MKHGALLAEIERDLLDGKPLADLLRKCIMLGGKSGSVELRDWASKELRGYAKAEELPTYRVVPAPIMVDGRNMVAVIKGQRVALSDLPDFVQEVVREEVPLLYPVGQLEAWVSRNTGEPIQLTLPADADLARYMTSQPGMQGQHIQALYWSVSPSSIHAVLDNIRTTLTELISELVGTMPHGQDLPTPEQAHQAVQVAVYGRKSQVTVTSALSSGDSTSTASHSPSAQLEDLDPAWWTLGRKIGAFVVGCAIILGTLIAVLAYYHH
jgi:hypothetical protein